MLGDNAERSKNPLKKAMRRRNAKTVQFSDPTYYEASDVDYSTDDEADDEEGVDEIGADADANNVQQNMRDDHDEITAVEPLRSDDPTASNTGNEPHDRVVTGNAADAKEARARSSSDSADTSKDESGDRNGKQRSQRFGRPVYLLGRNTSTRLTLSSRVDHQTPLWLRPQHGFLLQGRQHRNAEDHAHAQPATGRFGFCDASVERVSRRESVPATHRTSPGSLC